MSLTQEEIKKIVEKLSKLYPKNESKLLNSVNSILEYFEMLNEVDTSGVLPTVNVVSKKNILRDDILVENKEISPEELLACSNQKVVANQIAISNIMK